MYQESISFKFGKVKKAGKQDKAKVAAEIRKRIVVGLMVLATYVSPMYLGPCFLFPVNIYICTEITNEAFNLKMKPFEETPAYKLLRYLTIALTYYIWLPFIGGLRREILENSGLSA